MFWDAVNHLILPASILGLASLAYITRMTRSFMLDQLNQEYITTARVKGLSIGRTIWRHAFANIRVQLVTVVALAYGGLLEGAVLIETVFSWPGFGQYMTNTLLTADMNAVMTCVLLVGVVFIALNLLSDLLYRSSIRGRDDSRDHAARLSLAATPACARAPTISAPSCGTWRATPRRPFGLGRDLGADRAWRCSRR